MTRARVLALSIAVLMASPVAVEPVRATSGPGPSAHTVVMGAVDPSLANTTPRPPASAGRTDRFEYLAYYPDHLRVHRGDTVHFRRDGFHTVTFSAPGEPRSSWLRRDELEGVSAVTNMVASSDCGSGADLPPCVVSTTSPAVNSGWDDLTIEVDLPEGTYEYYCTLHEGMQGAVEVVADDVPVLSPEAVEEERAAQVALDTQAGAEALAAGQTPAAEPAGDHLRWTVKVGTVTSDHRVAVLRFLPSSLQVAPGDEVVFEVPSSAPLPPGRAEAATEIHTATFPDDPVLPQFGLLRYLVPACDADGVSSGLPGMPGMYSALLFGCPSTSELELLLSPGAWTSPTRAPGDQVITSATVHDTGILAGDNVVCRTGCDPWTQERFPSAGPVTTFPTPGTFGYVCLVHPEWGMAGSISVAQ